MTIAIGVRRQWAIQSIDNPIAALSILIVESFIFSLYYEIGLIDFNRRLVKSNDPIESNKKNNKGPIL